MALWRPAQHIGTLRLRSLASPASHLWRLSLPFCTHQHKRLSELLRYGDLPSTLASLLRGLEAVHKGVMEYLEEKRGNFPRFYFLANSEMVDLLVRCVGANNCHQ